MESPCIALGGKSYHASPMSTSMGRSQLYTVLVSMMELVSPPTYLGGVVTVSTHPYIGLVSVSASAASPLTHTTETGEGVLD